VEPLFKSVTEIHSVTARIPYLLVSRLVDRVGEIKVRRIAGLLQLLNESVIQGETEIKTGG
jgi:hypothetical protein